MGNKMIIHKVMIIIKIIFFIIIVFIITSCETVDKKLNENELISIALSKGIRRDTIFLGYILGMSYQQATKYKMNLYKNNTMKGVLIYDDNGYLESKDGSDIAFGMYEHIFVQHSLDFFEDKLYKVSAFIETNPQKETIYKFGKDDIDMFWALVEFYKNKYGKLTFTEPYDNELEIITWLEGNRKIQINPMPLLDRIYIYYADVSISTIMKSRNQKEKDSTNKIIREKSNDNI